MQYFKLSLGAIMLAIICTSGAAFAADLPTPAQSAEKIAITGSAIANEIRDYKVDVNVRGNMPVPDSNEPVKLDTSLVLKIRQKFGASDRDGFHPVEISLTDGQALIAGQILTISEGIYPKLTVLLDKNYHVNDVFGISGTSSTSLPGINYGNMAMLYFLPDSEKPHTIGEKWISTVALPNLGETYTFCTTIMSVDTVDGVKVAKVKQDISRVQKPGENKPDLKATADSQFIVATGKLLKSHLDCDVIFPQPNATPEDSKNPKQEPQGQRANIKMDILLIK